ncbi:hypothetical protein MJO28_013368 [Puccinia striiformis f. sp. tritici]|uniref:Uncharacterized protein n=1 Tax=Puccinia striiformis f. sp. tritici TaxID=168172 RepID=A0ACC0DZK1_9BASI|nr:hypothetical protein MJO28_013368 [Puccinia striiformis f. sp. tritici]
MAIQIRVRGIFADARKFLQTRLAMEMPIGDPSDVAKSIPSTTQQDMDQGDLVLAAYRIMASKCSPSNDERPLPTYNQRCTPIDQLRLRRDPLNQLESSLLPLLGNHLTRIQVLVEPHNLLKNPRSQLKLILDHQLELDQTLDQIISALHTICPTRTSDFLPTEENDGHFEEYKVFRFDGLDHYIKRELLESVMRALYESCQLIRHMGFSTPKCELECDPSCSRESWIEELNFCRDAIESTKQWFNGSEFDNVQAHWWYQLEDIDEVLEKFSILIDPPDSMEENEVGDEPVDNQSQSHSEGAIRLAKLVLPIIKLSRLFFKKLSRRGMNMKKFPLFTEMRSVQLRYLDDSAGQILIHLTQLYEILESVNIPFEVDTSGPDIIQIAEQIETDFQSFLYLILLHFLPQIPDNCRFTAQHYYAIWFVTWNTHLTIAISHLTVAAKSLRDDPL